MKKTYEKPVIITAVLKAEEITVSPQLSSYTIHQEESATKSWTTLSY